MLRAGYGVTFDTYTGVMQTYQQSIGTWPDSQFAQPAYNGVDGSRDQRQPSQQIGGNPLPTASPFGSAGWYANPQLDNAYSHQFNVELQQQLSNDLALSVAYVGAAPSAWTTTAPPTPLRPLGPARPPRCRHAGRFP